MFRGVFGSDRCCVRIRNRSATLSIATTLNRRPGVEDRHRLSFWRDDRRQLLIRLIAQIGKPRHSGASSQYLPVALFFSTSNPMDRFAFSSLLRDQSSIPQLRSWGGICSRIKNWGGRLSVADRLSQHPIQICLGALCRSFGHASPFMAYKTIALGPRQQDLVIRIAG